jgi:hypothetical protein
MFFTCSLTSKFYQVIKYGNAGNAQESLRQMQESLLKKIDSPDPAPSRSSGCSSLECSGSDVVGHEGEDTGDRTRTRIKFHGDLSLFMDIYGIYWV